MVPEQPVTGRLRFGLGLIGIGKPWGYANPEVPDESRARELLERARTLGVRYFDTAPSYGVSEERLGRFLASLSAADRGQLEIATKFGEHWDVERGEPWVSARVAGTVYRFSAAGVRLSQVSGLGNVYEVKLDPGTP